MLCGLSSIMLAMSALVNLGSPPKWTLCLISGAVSWHCGRACCKRISAVEWPSYLHLQQVNVFSADVCCRSNQPAPGIAMVSSVTADVYFSCWLQVKVHVCSPGQQPKH